MGTCIVNGDGQVVGVGYNGFATGISDDDMTMTWAAGKEEHPIRRKLPYGKDHHNNILCMIIAN